MQILNIREREWPCALGARGADDGVCRAVLPPRNNNRPGKRKGSVIISRQLACVACESTFCCVECFDVHREHRSCSAAARGDCEQCRDILEKVRRARCAPGRALRRRAAVAFENRATHVRSCSPGRSPRVPRRARSTAADAAQRPPAAR